MILQYVSDHLKRQGIESTVLTYEKVTRTCYEKADLLRAVDPRGDWRDNRIIKAIYALVDDQPYLFITPELKPRDGTKKRNISGRSNRYRRILHKYGKLTKPGVIDDQLVRRAFQEAGLSAQDYSPLIRPKHTYQELQEEWIPKWMEHGTCTPFPKVEDFQTLKDYGGLKRVFINDIPSLDEKMVDVSVGGGGEKAKRTSLQLPYETIYAILKENFPSHVHKLPFWEKSI